MLSILGSASGNSAARMLSMLVLLMAAVSIARASLYSGAEEVCSLSECDCVGETVTCTCDEDSSFQESFVFVDSSRRLRHLKILSCPRLVLPVNAISSEARRLVSVLVEDVRHVEVHSDAVTVTALREFTISSCALVTFQHQVDDDHDHHDNDVQDSEDDGDVVDDHDVFGDHLVTFQTQALKPGIEDGPVVQLKLRDIERAVVGGRAFASLRSFTATNIARLELEQHAFQLRVSTDLPTITIKIVNASLPSLLSTAFPSSFKSIRFEKGRIEKIATNAFSGQQINSITFNGTTIQRIERGAFSNNAAIALLHFDRCNISSLSQRSVVAGVSAFHLTNSEVKSIAKKGAIAATVASVRIEHNRFKTLSTEAFQFKFWDNVIINNNTFDFVEEGAIHGIEAPSEDLPTFFTFTDNRIIDTNMRSLVTQIPHSVNVTIHGNSFGKKCDCNIPVYIKSICGSSELSNPFVDLSGSLNQTSSCRVESRARPCFGDASSTSLSSYLHKFCPAKPVPPCFLQSEGDEEEEEVVSRVDGAEMATFYDEFVLLFQVKTTKGILLFLLFCVLSSVATVTICVAAIWVQRLCRRAKLPRDHMSGSFQFNSGEEKQVLYGSDQTTCSMGEEPQYAEIAEVHPLPREVGEGTLAAWVTLPNSSPFHSSTMETTLPSLANSTLPIRGGTDTLPALPTDSSNSDEVEVEKEGESASLLSGSLETTQVSRLSMSETSLADEIMLALKDKLNDPNMYMSVLDAKAAGMSPVPASPVKVEPEDLYCAPVYSDPLMK